MTYVLFRAQGEELAGGIALYVMFICVLLGILGRCLGWDDPTSPRGHVAVTGPALRAARKAAAEKAKIDKQLAKEFGITLPGKIKGDSTVSALAAMDVALGGFSNVVADARASGFGASSLKGASIKAGPRGGNNSEGTWRPPLGDAPASPFVSARSHLTSRLEALRSPDFDVARDAPSMQAGSGGSPSRRGSAGHSDPIVSPSSTIFTATSYAAYVESKPGAGDKKKAGKGSKGPLPWSAAASDGALPARIKYPSSGGSTEALDAMLERPAQLEDILAGMNGVAPSMAKGGKPKSSRRGSAGGNSDA